MSLATVWLFSNELLRNADVISMQSFISPDVVFSVTEVVGELSLDLYSGEPSNTSSCIDVDIPEILTVGQTLVLNVSASSSSLNALAYDPEEDTEVLDLSQCDLHSLNHSYDLIPMDVTHQMTVVDWTDNPACSLRFDHTFNVLELITELNVSTLPAIAILNETELELTAWVDGTRVAVSVNWEDSYIYQASCVNYAELSAIVFNYTYEMEGTFAVSVTASNLISRISMDKKIISVSNLIRDLAIYGSSIVLTPPGTGIWGVAAGTDQSPVENIVCVWNMGTNYEDTIHNISVLNCSMPHEITFSYGQQVDVGIQTINVNCSNPVSCQNLSMDVTVVWDNVTLGELTCNSSTLWNHSITCELTIVRFGTGACFEWDMDDGKPLVYYQDGYCATIVTSSSPTFVQVNLIKGL